MPEWVAERYDSLSLPHEQWGRRVVAGFSLRGDETVVDLGCGTGRDLELVLQRLPRGRAVGVDQSTSMVQRVRERFAVDPRVEVVCADLGEALPIAAGSADAVMSVAALHWLPNHVPVWNEIARILKPGGQVRLECGGHGNVARVVDGVRMSAGGAAVPNWTFPTTDNTEHHMRLAGLVDVRVTLRSAPVVFPDEQTFRRYLRTLVLHDLEALALDQVAEQLRDRTIDYVRLEASGRLPD